jgi:hypothetical protein
MGSVAVAEKAEVAKKEFHQWETAPLSSNQPSANLQKNALLKTKETTDAKDTIPSHLCGSMLTSEGRCFSSMLAVTNTT